jgi:hypothetical protein
MSQSSILVKDDWDHKRRPVPATGYRATCRPRQGVARGRRGYARPGADETPDGLIHVYAGQDLSTLRTAPGAAPPKNIVGAGRRREGPRLQSGRKTPPPGSSRLFI